MNIYKYALKTIQETAANISSSERNFDYLAGMVDMAYSICEEIEKEGRETNDIH